MKEAIIDQSTFLDKLVKIVDNKIEDEGNLGILLNKIVKMTKDLDLPELKDAQDVLQRQSELIRSDLTPNKAAAQYKSLKQLKQLNNFIKRRRRSAELYTSFFENHQDVFKYIKPNSRAYSSWFGFPLVLTGKLIGKRKELRQILLENNVESRPFLAGDFTLQPVVKSFKHFKSKNLKVSSSIASDGLAIPCHQDVSEENVLKVISLFEKFINQAI